MKLEKAARKSAENSTCLHSYSFKVNTCKSQVNQSFLVSQLREKYFLDSDQKYAGEISEEAVTESEVIFQHK